MLFKKRMFYKFVNIQLMAIFIFHIIVLHPVVPEMCCTLFDKKETFYHIQHFILITFFKKKYSNVYEEKLP